MRFVTAVLIWVAVSIPAILILGRIIAGVAGESNVPTAPLRRVEDVLGGPRPQE